jgi:glutamine amidotransferase
MKVSIIDYGMGNVASVQKALNFLGINNVITSDHQLISESDVILLPGVGSFKQGMKNLNDRGLDTLMTDLVIGKKKKFLGICLGMQLIAKRGTEPDITEGLGWIPGTVRKIESDSLRIPHMGWNDVNIRIPLFFNNIEKKDYYFIHSYHFIPENESCVAATVNYGSDMVAAVQQDNIFAVQFHPEKSQSAGLALLKNYFEHA